VPAFNPSLRVQVLLLVGQVHPVPVIEVSVNPAGSASVTTTGPTVGPSARSVRHRHRVSSPCLPLREAAGVRRGYAQCAGGAILATKDVVLLPTAVNPGPSTI